MPESSTRGEAATLRITPHRQARDQDAAEQGGLLHAQPLTPLVFPSERAAIGTSRGLRVEEVPLGNATTLDLRPPKVRNEDIRGEGTTPSQPPEGGDWVSGLAVTPMPTWRSKRSANANTWRCSRMSHATATTQHDHPSRQQLLAPLRTIRLRDHPIDQLRWKHQARKHQARCDSDERRSFCGSKDVPRVERPGRGFGIAR
jgi:hypothetical protein